MDIYSNAPDFGEPVVAASIDRVNGQHYCWNPSCTRTPSHLVTVLVEKLNANDVEIHAYCKMHTEDVVAELAHGEPPNTTLLNTMALS